MGGPFQSPVEAEADTGQCKKTLNWNGGMGGWVDRWMDGWTDGRMVDGWVDGQMEGLMWECSPLLFILITEHLD